MFAWLESHFPETSGVLHCSLAENAASIALANKFQGRVRAQLKKEWELLED
jgi:hypothetical protein